ncbi:MAG TPA: hypothetical protein VJR71_13455, partial [Pseudolabrys sp.]|nr:hypothetical protein [Pseudolabrys sp.]
DSWSINPTRIEMKIRSGYSSLLAPLQVNRREYCVSAMYQSVHAAILFRIHGKIRNNGIV